MANKYLALLAGVPTQVEGITTSAGAGDSGKFTALDAAGKLSLTMMPTGVAPDVAVVVASEALSAGDYVNVWSDAAAFKVRKADASTAGKEAHGFVKAAFDSAASATVYFEGPNDQVTGQSPGVVYLSTSPGVGTATPPSSTGNVVQNIGIATSATSANFERGQHYVLA